MGGRGHGGDTTTTTKPNKASKERKKNSNKKLNIVGLVLIYHNGCNLGINPLKLVRKVKEESHT